MKRLLQTTPVLLALAFAASASDFNDRDALTGQLHFEGAAALVAQLSDDQVFALNRALNDTVHNTLAVQLDAALVQRIIDENLGNREIQQLTQGVELGARFDQNADRLDAKADASGNAVLHDRAAEMRDRGAALEEKFLSGPGSDTAQAAAKAAAASEARDAAREAARESAREARHAAREAAREAAHETALDLAHAHGAP